MICSSRGVRTPLAGPRDDVVTLYLRKSSDLMERWRDVVN